MSYTIPSYRYRPTEHFDKLASAAKELAALHRGLCDHIRQLNTLLMEGKKLDANTVIAALMQWLDARNTNASQALGVIDTELVMHETFGVYRSKAAQRMREYRHRRKLRDSKPPSKLPPTDHIGPLLDEHLDFPPDSSNEQD